MTKPLPPSSDIVKPSLGFGLGLRPTHYQELLSGSPKPEIDWFEVISENVMGLGGRGRRMVERLRSDYPFACHGVSLSIAGSDPLDPSYLKALRELIAWLEPEIVSDHLCWTSWKGRSSYDLLPFPFNRESLAHVARRVDFVQEYLGRRILLENPSCYLDFEASEMPEAVFLAELCEQTGCGILLDLNNCIVNQRNLAWDPDLYLSQLKPEWVQQFHLAGHTVHPDISIDTHDQIVPEAVWDLYRRASSRFSNTSVLVEWDEHIPSLVNLIKELAMARELSAKSQVKDAELSAIPHAYDTLKSYGEETKTLVALQASLFSSTIGEHQDETPFRNAPTARSRGLTYHRQSYALRLLEVLQLLYPAIHFILEDELFGRLARRYIESLTIMPYSINEIGDQLPDFLRSKTLDLNFGAPQSAIADLAQLEQSFASMQGTSDDPDQAFDAQSWSQWGPDDWEKATFAARTEQSCLSFDWQVFPVWKAARDQMMTPPPAIGRQYVQVFRFQGELQVVELSEREHQLWRLLARGASLSELLALWDDECSAEKAMAELMPRLIQAAQLELLSVQNLGKAKGRGTQRRLGSSQVVASLD